MEQEQSWWSRFCRDEAGNTAVEYAAVLALVVGASVTAMSFFNQAAGDLLERIGNSSSAPAESSAADEGTAEEPTAENSVVTYTVITASSGAGSGGNGNGNGNGKSGRSGNGHD